MRAPPLTSTRRAALLLMVALSACKQQAPAPEATATGEQPVRTAPTELTLYTTREPGLVQPLLDTFTQDTGIKVATVFVRDGLPERLKAEGERSPADVLMTVDSSNLLDLVQAGLTQPVKSEVLEAAIPAHLRGADGQWFALSLRDRVLYARKDLRALVLHLRGTRGSEVEGEDLHPLRAAPVQHGPHRGDGSRMPVRRRPRPGCAA